MLGDLVLQFLLALGNAFQARAELDFQRVLARPDLLVVGAHRAFHLGIAVLELVLQEGDLAGLFLQVLPALELVLVEDADLVQRPAQRQARGLHVVYRLLVEGRFVKFFVHRKLRTDIVLFRLPPFSLGPSPINYRAGASGKRYK